MQTATPPKRRHRVWTTILGMVLALLAGAGAFAWYVASHLGPQPDGSRVTLVFPGGSSGAASRSLEPSLAADLAADGVEIRGGGSRMDVEQTIFVRREKVEWCLFLKAGKEPLDTARLGYVLFRKDGAEVSRGPLRPELQIAPGQTDSVLVVDPLIADADRVEIRKLP
jgi:hypothetical protein